MSEVDLGTEFHQAGAENRRGLSPIRSVGEDFVQHGAGVEQVVDIESSLHAGPRDVEDLRQSYIELVQPVLEERVGDKQRDGRRSRRTGCQVAAERRQDLSVGGDVIREDRDSSKVLKHRARLKAPPRKWIGTRQLDLRLSRPGRDNVTEGGRGT